LNDDRYLRGPAGSFGAVSQDYGVSPQSATGPVQPGPTPARRYSDGPTIGAGGFGVVRSVHDHWLGRDVALKELHAAAPEQEARLHREAKLTAELDHPGIVPIYDVGRTAEGRLYYTMRLVVGGTLGHRIARAQTDPERLDLVPLVRDAARAIAFAHARGVVHRDLKPDNVMVGPLGDVQVADWGLAQAIADGVASAGPAGTPRFLSPEAAAGAPCRPTDDVFSLGAILYAVLAGAAPWADRDSAAALDAVRQAPIPPLSDAVPPELRAIVSRATARDPDARYPTALAFAEDLTAWMSGRRVTAHTYSPRELLGRFVRAFRAPIVVGAIALVVTIILVGLSWQRTAEERNAAVDARRDAEEKTAALLVQQAIDADARDATPEALAWAREAMTIGSAAVRERARGIIMTAGAYPEVTRERHEPLTECLVVVPIGAGESWLCQREGELARQSVPGADLWAAKIDVRAVAPERSGRWAAIVDTSDGLHRLDLLTGSMELVDSNAAESRHVGISRDGSTLWSGNTGLIRWVRMGLPPVEHIVQEAERGQRLIHLDADPSGTLTGLTSHGRRVTLGPSPIAAEPMVEASDRLLHAACSLRLDDGDWLVGTTTGEILRVSATRGGIVPVARLESAAAIQRFTRWPQSGGRTLLIVETTTDGAALVDLDGGGTVGRLSMDARGPFVVRSDATVLSFGSGLSSWRLTAEPRARRHSMPQGIGALSVANDGAAFVAGGGSGFMALGDGARGGVVPWALDGTGVIKSLAFEPGGRRVAVGRMELRGAEVYDTGSGDRLAFLPTVWSQRRVGWLERGVIWGIGYDEPWHVWRPDGTEVARGPHDVTWLDAQGSTDGRGAMFLDTRGEVLRLDGDTLGVTPVATHPGASAIAADRDGAYWLLGPAGITAHDATGTARRTIPSTLVPGGARAVSAMSMSRDGALLAVGLLDGQLVLWDAASGERLAIAHPHRDRVAVLTFAADDGLLWSGSWDGQVALMTTPR
jgi:hypothetical protein